jgi:acyl-CoA thioester hydrolase
MTPGTIQREARPHAPRRSAFGWWTQEKLRNADTDQFRHVNNAVLCTLLEAGRLEVFSEHTVRSLMLDTSPAIVRLEVDFLREVHYPGRVDIGTAVIAAGTSSIRFGQGLFIGDDCVASAQAVCVLIHPGTRRSQPLPEPLKRQLLSISARETS